ASACSAKACWRSRQNPILPPVAPRARRAVPPFDGLPSAAFAALTITAIKARTFGSALLFCSSDLPWSANLPRICRGDVANIACSALPSRKRKSRSAYSAFAICVPGFARTSSLTETLLRRFERAVATEIVVPGARKPHETLRGCDQSIEPLPQCDRHDPITLAVEHQHRNGHFA